MGERKIKIGMVQINNKFANANYLPYSVGIIQAYAQSQLKDPDRFEFLLPIYSRIPVQEAVEYLKEADIVGFSTYVWNVRISLKIAEELKKIHPKALIIFGGPQVPNKETEQFLRQHPFIDMTFHGEGENPFLKFLENYESSNWNEVPSISYINKDNQFVQNLRSTRIHDLDTIPSPYTSGIFKELMAIHPQEDWLVLWETNRGCPFSCTFCDWGSAVNTKVHKFNIERLFAELDWIAKNKIEFIYCGDANFGIFERDIELAQYAAKNKRLCGYPKALSVQNTKNSTENSYKIQKILAEAGLNKGVTLSIQSMSKEVLTNIKRANIKLEVYHELQKRFATDSIETYTDFILALPGETYDSFKSGVSALIENGQHNRIQFNNLSILPNAEMNDAEYKAKHGIVIKETKAVNMHTSLAEEEEVCEMQQLVVATKTMPPADWIKVRAFSWMTALLHFDKALQIPLIILHRTCGVSFRELIEAFIDVDKAKFPILNEINEFFTRKAQDIQNGGEEYCSSEKWLNLWWPADELILIEMCTSGKIKEFYAEVNLRLKEFLKEKNLDLPPDLVNQAIELNQNLMKLPFQTLDLSAKFSYNIFDAYKAALEGVDIPVEEGTYNYTIDRTTQRWSSWEEWCKEVIWYGNKKGAYLYKSYLIEDRETTGALA